MSFVYRFSIAPETCPTIRVFVSISISVSASVSVVSLSVSLQCVIYCLRSNQCQCLPPICAYRLPEISSCLPTDRLYNNALIPTAVHLNRNSTYVQGKSVVFTFERPTFRLGDRESDGDSEVESGAESVLNCQRHPVVGGSEWELNMQTSKQLQALDM